MTPAGLPTPQAVDTWRRNITERRLINQWSRRELARRSGINSSTISRVETATGYYLPEIRTITYLSHAVGWSTQEVAGLLAWDTYTEYLDAIRASAAQHGYTVEASIDMMIEATRLARSLG